MTATQTLEIQEVHLAADEWGNSLMREIAVELINQQYNDFYVVEVHEHGGWWLQFARFNGEVMCVGSANDSAQFTHPIRKFHRMIRKMPTVQLPAIRR